MDRRGFHKGLLSGIVSAVLARPVWSRNPRGIPLAGAPAPPTPGWDGTWDVSGNKFVNGVGATFQPVGVNVSGAEYGPIGNYIPNGSAFAGNEPTISALQSWGLSAIRFPVNEASWMGGVPAGANASGIAARLVYDDAGVLNIPDPANNYKASYIAMAQAINAGGMGFIADMHWTAPSNIAPRGQDVMANTDNTIPAWTDIATTFAAYPGVALEPFNEPYGSLSYATLGGPSGTCTGGSTTTVVDSTQKWATNMWVGCTITNNTNSHSAVVTANTATTLTFAAMASANIAGNSYTFTTITNSIQVMMQGGTCSKALCWFPNYTLYGILQLSSYTGVFYPGDTITQGSVTATVKSFDAVKLKVYYSPASATFTTGTITKTAGKAAMTCLTRAGQGGIATGGSTTTLTDSTRSWTTNQWVGYTLYDVNNQTTSAITANTATTLTFGAVSTAVAAQDQYMITKPLIVPVASSSANGPTTYANNGIFGNTFNLWRTSATPTPTAPQYIAFFINNPAVRNILLQWGNDGTFMYNPYAEQGPPSTGTYYNIPDTYTIDVNPSTSSTYPTSGWINAVSQVNGNLYTKRAHLVALQGGMWVRVNFTVGSPLNANYNQDVAMVMDIWDATYGVSDGVVHVGDSITALGQGFGPENHVTSTVFIDSFNNMANGYGGNYNGSQLIPPVLNAGIAYWTAQNYLGPTNGFTFAGMLAANPSRYMSMILGTNNLANWNNGTDPASYTAAMQNMISQAQQAGKVVVVHTIPWLSDSSHQAGLPTYNAIVTGTLQTIPGVIAGVDFYTYFNNTFTGTLTGGSTTTIVDSTRNWAPNAYIGVTVQITSGPNNGASAVVTSNTTTSMTFAAMSSANTSGTTYKLNGQALISTDGIHPNSQGLGNMRRLLAYFFANLPQTATGVVSNPAATWGIAGQQQLINAIRATTATNPVLVSGDSYANDLSRWLANMPTDSAGQMAAVQHTYPPDQQINTATIVSGGSGWSSADIGKTLTLPWPTNNTVYNPGVLVITAVSGGAVTAVSASASGASRGSYLQAISNGPGNYDTNLSQLPTNPIAMASTTGAGSGVTVNISWQNASSQFSLPTARSSVETIKATYPVIITETGESSYSGWVGAPWTTDLFGWGNSHGIGILGWEWVVGVYPGNLALITDPAGDPAPGYGVVFKALALAE